MPAPPSQPTSFLSILEQVWWRLDAALDHEMIRASAQLGALEALEAGTTAIIDHHESPNAIEGSLDIIADACAEVGVRVVCAYGVTDRHGPDGARRGLEENDRFLTTRRSNATTLPGMVGVHAAFTCNQATLEAAAALATTHGVGVHVHVAEGIDDIEASTKLAKLSTDDWLIVHAVHLDSTTPLRGTIVHNPRSNMNNSVGYARPTRFEPAHAVALGTDGIGADMLDEFRFAYACARAHDLTFTPDQAWQWVQNGAALVPPARHDTVLWSYDGVDEPWRSAFTTGVHAIDVTIEGEVVLRNGVPTRVDADEIRAHAAEQALRLFAKL